MRDVGSASADHGGAASCNDRRQWASVPRVEAAQEGQAMLRAASLKPVETKQPNGRRFSIDDAGAVEMGPSDDGSREIATILMTSRQR